MSKNVLCFQKNTDIFLLFQKYGQLKFIEHISLFPYNVIYIYEYARIRIYMNIEE